MAEYIKKETLDELMENRNVRGDCKFCAKYERCIQNGINRKGSHLYCWEKIELPTADVVKVVRCKDCTEWDKDECECSHWYGFRENDFCSYGKRRDKE